MYYHYITLYIIIKYLYIFDCLVPPLLMFVHIWNSRLNCSQALRWVCCWWFDVCLLLLYFLFIALTCIFSFFCGGRLLMCVHIWNSRVNCSQVFCWKTSPRRIASGSDWTQSLREIHKYKITKRKYTNTKTQKHTKIQNTQVLRRKTSASAFDWIQNKRKVNSFKKIWKNTKLRSSALNPSL